MYTDADYLLYHIRRGHLPPTASVVPVGLLSVNSTDLFTTSPTTPGTPGNTRTAILPVSIQSNAAFATGTDTEFGSQNGGRFQLGFWCDPEQTWGLEATGMLLERGSDHFAAITGSSNNAFNIPTGLRQNLFLVGGMTPTLLRSFPIIVTRESTSSFVGSTSNTMYGGELNSRCVGMRIGCVDIGGLAGFRYLLYKEDLTLASSTRLTSVPGVADPGTTSLPTDLNFSTLDRIRLWNHFFGGQAGVDFDIKCGSFFLYARGQLALGDMHQVAQVNGITQVTNNDPRTLPASSTTAGGLLSSPADIGRQSRDRFAYLPEVNLKLGYQFTSWLRGYVGFDALMIDHAARAGDSSSINTVNANVTVAGSANTANVATPSFRFRDSDVWAQGLTFGMEVRY
jgi:hypothetical protein